MAEENNEAYKESVNLADQQLASLKEQSATIKKLVGETNAYKTLMNQIALTQNAIKDAKKTESDISKDLLKINKQGIKDNKAYIKPIKERNDLAEQHKTQLKDSLGLNSEIFSMIKKGAFAALGFMVLAKVVGFLSDMVSSSLELSKELGISVVSAAKFEMNITAAKFSMAGLLHSTEELRSAAKAVVELTGRINVSPETIGDVAKLTSLLGDAGEATSLQRTLQNAGVDAGDLTDSVMEMADSLGMDAGPAMEYLASNQLELGGLTEQQMLVRAKEGLMMKKMGVDMKKMNDLASGALDIEKSLKDEMKLRMITGKEINLNELRAAQASGDAFAVAEAQKNLVSALGDDLQSNLQVQRLISEATGMEKADLLNIKNSSAEITKEQEKQNAQAQSLADIFAIITPIVDGVYYIFNGIGTIIGHMVTGLSESTGLLIAFSLAILPVAMALISGAIGAIFSTFALIPMGLGMPLAAAAVVGMASAISSATAVGDVMSPADGKTRISTKEGGLLELSDNDDLIAAPGIAGSAGGGGGIDLSGLINEIKGLRRDIQAQPIMMTVDGKVVSAITKVQNRQNSVSTTGYGR